MKKKKKVKKKVGVKRKTLKAKKKVVVGRKRKKAAMPKKKAAMPKKKAVKKTSLPAGVSLEEVGAITHYFPRVEAAVLKLTKGALSVGDKIIIKGHTTDFKEKVDSMQLDHAPITSASVGQEIGIRVKSKVREHDAVYKLVS